MTRDLNFIVFRIDFISTNCCSNRRRRGLQIGRACMCVCMYATGSEEVAFRILLRLRLIEEVRRRKNCILFLTQIDFCASKYGKSL